MPQLDKSTIKRRAAEMRHAVAETRAKWLERQIGVPQSVLAETDGTGYAANFARVAVPAQTARGTIVAVTPTRLEGGLLS